MRSAIMGNRVDISMGYPMGFTMGISMVTYGIALDIIGFIMRFTMGAAHEEEVPAER